MSTKHHVTCFNQSRNCRDSNIRISHPGYRERIHDRYPADFLSAITPRSFPRPLTRIQERPANAHTGRKPCSYVLGHHNHYHHYHEVRFGVLTLNALSRQFVASHFSYNTPPHYTIRLRAFLQLLPALDNLNSSILHHVLK